MLAARRLYPGAVVCLSGSLTGTCASSRACTRRRSAPSRPPARARRVRRLVVVDTVHAARLGELEPVALDPAVDKVVFHHHPDEPPDWLPEQHLVLSTDGALTTTFVGILAEREHAVTPLEATAFALGIHEDTGSLTYPTATARRGALAGAAGTGRARTSWRRTCTRRSARTSASCSPSSSLSSRRVGDQRLGAPGRGRARARLRGGSVEPGAQDRGPDRLPCARLPRRGRGPRRRGAAQPGRRDRRRAARGGARRRRPCRGRVRDFPPLARRGRASRLAALPRAAREPLRARDIMSRPPRTVGPAETVASAMVACQRHRQSGILVAEDGQARRRGAGARTSTRRSRTACRTHPSGES